MPPAIESLPESKRPFPEDVLSEPLASHDTPDFGVSSISTPPSSPMPNKRRRHDEVAEGGVIPSGDAAALPAVNLPLTPSTTPTARRTLFVVRGTKVTLNESPLYLDQQPQTVASTTTTAPLSKSNAMSQCFTLF